MACVQVNFTVVGDTATKNASKVGKEDREGLSVDLNDTSSLHFLRAVVARLPANASVNYWVQTRSGRHGSH